MPNTEDFAEQKYFYIVTPRRLANGEFNYTFSIYRTITIKPERIEAVFQESRGIDLEYSTKQEGIERCKQRARDWIQGQTQ